MAVDSSTSSSSSSSTDEVLMFKMNSTRYPAIAVDPEEQAIQISMNSQNKWEKSSRMENEYHRAFGSSTLKWILLVVCLVAATCVVQRAFNATSTDRKFVYLFPIFYRAIALLLLGGWCWGINVQFLDKFKLEYTSLFDLDIGSKITCSTTYQLSMFLSTALGIHIILFSIARGIPSTFLPLCMYATFALLLLWPRSPFRDARFALMKALTATIASPITGVHFAHVIFADLLTSYSKVFHDMYGAICVIMNSSDQHFHGDLLRVCRNDHYGLLVASLPSWLRLVQCLSCYASEKNPKHLFNALKYGSAFPVLFFSFLYTTHSNSPSQDTMQKLWLVSLVINSVYSYYWDVYNDWGLGSLSSTHCFLRDRLLFPKRWLYWLAIFSDLMLRFTWSLQLSPHWYLLGAVGRELQMFVLETVEILRRCMWIFFRCEWQQIVVSS